MTPLNGTANPAAGSKILVVDDEPAIVDAVATALRYEGFDVAEAANGRDAISRTMDFDPDLIVLDWMLPDIDGIEVGRRLRERGFRTAILFLTAKGGVENKVEALRAGGDDYVTKPFSLAEIVARVQAILRRTAGDLPGDVLRCGDLLLDEGRHEVFRGEHRVDLVSDTGGPGGPGFGPFARANGGTQAVSSALGAGGSAFSVTWNEAG